MDMGDEIEKQAQLGIGCLMVPFLQVWKTEDMEEITHTYFGFVKFETLLYWISKWKC